MKFLHYIHKDTNRYVKNERGSTLIESAALMLPFLLLFLGIVEFGWYFLHQHTLQFSTREGMRMALVGSTLLDQNGDALSREESIKETIGKQAQWAMNIEPEKIWIFQVGDNYSDPDDWKTSAANAGNPADYMRVRVQYDHEFFTPLIGGFFSADRKVTMEAEGTYRNELF